MEWVPSGSRARRLAGLVVLAGGVAMLCLGAACDTTLTPDVPDTPSGQPVHHAEADLTPSPQCKYNADCVGLLQLGPCRIAVCDHVTERCIMGYKHEFAPCSPSDPCLGKWVCVSGECVPFGGPDVCDDGEVCTADSCVSMEGCVHSPVAGPCDDDLDFTIDDTRHDGACVGQPLPCSSNADCGYLTEGSCVPQVRCSSDGVCEQDPSPLVACPIASAQCHSNECWGTDGLCHDVLWVNGTPCEDACGTEGKCQAGECLVVDAPCECMYAVDCGTTSYFECWAYACFNGYCTPVASPQGAPCIDHDYCTAGETCDGDSLCEPDPSIDVCDDEDPCTTDTCHTGLSTCTYEPVPCDTAPECCDQ